jgi:hypothetical protein
MRPRDVNVKFLHRRANTANDFGGPERLAEERDPTVFRLADGAKSVAGVRRLIGVKTASREGPLQLGVCVGIAALHWTASADAEGLTLEALEKFLKLRFGWLRQHETAFSGFAIVNFVKLAEFADAVEVTEEVHDKEFIGSESGKNAGPN